MQNHNIGYYSGAEGMPFVPLHKLFVRPTDYFYRLDQKPHWLPAFFVVCLIAVSVSMLHRPYSEQVMLRSLTVTMGAEKAAHTVELSRSMRWIGVALVPFEKLIKVTVISVFVFYSLQLFGPGRLAFMKVFAVVVCSEFIPAAVSIVNVGILYTRDISAVTASTDFTAVPGLDLFLSEPGSKSFAYTVLNSFNIGSLWYLWVLCTGLAVISGIRKRTVLLVTAGLWILSIAVELLMMVITSRLVKDIVPQ